jgi:hypothetical protein
MDLRLTPYTSVPDFSSTPPPQPTPASAHGLVISSPRSGVVLLPPSGAPRHWPRGAGARPFGAPAALDPRAGVVYAALDGPAGEVAAFGAGSDGDAGSRVVECGFHGKGGLARMRCLSGVRRDGCGDVVAAVSKTGCVVLLRAGVDASGELASVSVFRNVADLDVTDVVGIDASVPGYCAFAALRGRRLGLHVLKVDNVASGGDIEAELFDTLWAPQAPRGTASKVLGFAIQPHAAFVLYAGGGLHVFSPRDGLVAEKHGQSLEAWRTPVPDEAGASSADEVAADGDAETSATENVDKNPEVRAGVPANPAAQGVADKTAGNADVADEGASSMKAPRYKKLGHQRKDGKAAKDSSVERPRGTRKKTRRMYQHRVKFDITLRPTVSATPAATHVSTSPLAPSLSTGGVASVGGGYVVVGYGRVVSVWDGVYGTGHGYIDLPENVVSVSAGSKSGEALVLLTSGAIYTVAIDADDDVLGLTLALALMRQGTCQPIIASHNVDDTTAKAPLHSQPVSVGILKATADAGGGACQLFETHIKQEDQHDERRIRTVLDLNASPTAAKVSAAISTYVFGNAHTRARRAFEADVKLRKPGSAPPKSSTNAAQLGLDRLPSERLAATVVARCLRELHADRLEFLTPFIDMVGSGVVSSALVLAVMTKLQASTAVVDPAEQGGPAAATAPVSMTATLLRSPATSAALEAMVMRVVDLSEVDTARIAQFAVRLRQLNVGLGREGSDEDERKVCAQVRLRAERVLSRCLATPVNDTDFVQSLQSMPPHDVVSMLRYLAAVLDDHSTAMRAAFPGDSAPDVAENGTEYYRGDHSWLDKPVFPGASRDEATARIQARCVEWIGKVVDAHMSTLIMDTEGSFVVGQLLESIRVHRRRAEIISPLVGMIHHLSERKALPNSNDPLYSLVKVKVPSFAALT